VKVLLVSLYFVEYALELANALGKNNRVHLLLLKNRVHQTIGANQLNGKLSNNVTYTLLPYRSFRHPSILRVLFSILNLHFSFKPDVVHVQECNNPLNLLFFLFKFKPVVTTVHDVVLHPGTEASTIKSWRFLVGKKLREHTYNKIIVHGEKLKRLFLSNNKRLDQDVFVIPHGCLFTFPQYKNENVREEPHTVLFFGRIEKYKGLKYLIEAEPLVSKILPDFKIIVAGRGEDVKTHRAKLLSNPHFELHDRFIPNDEVAHLFQRASAVVLPYIEASQSGIAAMAFAFGKPVISTNVGSLAEMIEHKITGIIIPPKDKLALSKAIIKILSDTQQRLYLSDNAQKASLTKFCWDNIAKLTGKVYKKAVE